MKDGDVEDGSDLSALGYLRLIEQAVQLRLSHAGIEQSNKQGWVGLMFLSGHSVLMTPLEELVGIMPISNFAPIPGVKPWMLGLASYRGEIFSVTDFAGMLTNELTPLSKDSRILITSTQDEYSGLLVSRVLSLQRVTSQHGVEELPKGLMGEYEPFTIGAIINEGFQLPIISCKLIVRYPRFKDIKVN